MKAEEIVQLVHSVLPDAQVLPQGADCNFSIAVISPAFEGMKLLARQQLVLAAFESVLRTGELHALSVKTWTPAEAAEQQQPVQLQLG